MAAKSVALVVLPPEALREWKTEYGASHFSAEDMDGWYVPYMDYLYEHGFLDEAATPADEDHAQGTLTYGEAKTMMDAFSPELGALVRADRKNSGKPFPEEQWWLLYDSVLRREDPDGQVKTVELAIYGTPDNVPGTPPWTAHTSLGRLGFSGESLDRFLDHELSAYVREDELIHVIEDRGQDTVYRNVWVMDGDEKGLTVYLGDIERQLSFKRKTKKTDQMIHSMADLQMEDGRIARVSLKTDTITGKVLSVQEEAVELEDYGLVPLDTEYKVLKTYGQVERRELSDILVGYDTEEFVVARGKICGVLMVREPEADVIRVLLMDSGFRSLYHSSLTFSGTGAVTVIQDKKKKQLDAGEQFTVTAGAGELGQGRIILEPADGGEIQVRSVERAQGIPSYGGRLEIVEAPEGLVLINELYLEDYLKKVVPSEMPTSYELEALKAQAVCARTYAYMQLQSNTYSQYGAHVDDSTNFQVYNNVETDGRAAEAVQQTYGKMLLYGGKPVSAYYFSTSCGVTADAAVWGSDPAESPYLKSVALQPGRGSPDLRSNDSFDEFIRRQDVSAYDSSYPFFRWSVTTNSSVLTANIGGVGEVTGLRVTERGNGGVALKLLVTGTEGEKTISGQNAIRAALGDESLTIHRKDGKTVDGWASLPSGFISVQKLEDGTQFKIYGGGYGHGVGMSQNGAQGMAEAGLSCQDILEFFYDGVSVEELPEKENTNT
ncbi:MAG: SpoIID/LytB domain-containing protein [Eubacteriales bacterium]|nr:SpoIID/LytB domain-containing protein [Eubacteriales bacterium]